MKEQIKAAEIIQLSSEQMANLSDAQFKTLVIKKLTELVEFGQKLHEKMKAMLRETKENVQEPIVRLRKLGLKSMVWTRRKKETLDQKEERNFQAEDGIRDPYYGLVGSEMCIRDRASPLIFPSSCFFILFWLDVSFFLLVHTCLLYTSDAADE